jgi:hypothetical protein
MQTTTRTLTRRQKIWIAVGILMAIGFVAHLAGIDKKSTGSTSALHGDAVQVAAEVEIVISDAAGSDVNATAVDAITAHSTLTNLKSRVLTDAPNNDAGNKLNDAVNGLKNSMGAMGALLDNPTPETLASVQTQLNPAVSEWNDAAATFWPGDDTVHIS